MLRRILILIGLLFITLPLHAQYDTFDFHWQLTDIGFSYPPTWEEPFAVQQFGIESVVLARSDAHNPERAPEVPFIIMALFPAEDTDTASVLQDRMLEFNIIPNVTIPTTLLNQDGLWSRGTSRDESFVGLGIAIPWEDMILTIVGRAPAEQASLFEYKFDTVTRSLAQGQSFGEVVPFGLIWSNSADIDEEGVDFVSISAITLDEAHQTLYAVDDFLGVLQFDSASGRLVSIIPNPDLDLPTDIAIGADNTIYISDIGCQCIHMYQNNSWQAPLTGFGEDAPWSIATTSTGDLYATNAEGFDISIKHYGLDEESNRIENPEMPLGDDIEDQPLLFVTNDQLYYLDPFTDEIIRLADDGLTPMTTLQLESIPLAIDMTLDGTYVTVSNSTVELYTTDGILMRSLDSVDFSSASDIGGLAVGSDNTLYFATHKLRIGEVLAISQRVPQYRYGLQTLAPYRLSGGILNDDHPSDIWLINGNNRDLFSLFVQGYSQLSDFDYSVTVVAPDGSEVVTVDTPPDNQVPLERNIENIELSSNGIYEVHINHLYSEGIYEIVMVSPKPFELSPDTTIVYGELGETNEKDIWAFEADGRTTITFTLEAIDSTQLDVTLSLSDAQFQQVAQNNDAENDQLGNNAQIVEFTLPRTGLYYLEALKVTGVGKYKLTLDIIEPES